MRGELVDGGLDGVGEGRETSRQRELARAAERSQVDAARDHVLIGKERHDVGRPNDVGYPIRGIVKDAFLYLHNFETSRWPAG